MDELSRQRQLGLATATAMIVGEVIGVGIFLTPAGMAKSLGSPFWILVVWLAVAAMSLCGALCYGELAARFPQTGGGYVYLRHAYGPRMAFLYGWMALLVVDPGLTALFASGFTSYAGYAVELTEVDKRLLAVAVIFLFAAINAFGVRRGAWVLRWLTGFKLGLLAMIAFCGLVLGLGDWSNFIPFIEQRPGADPLLKALAAGLGGAFFSFAGWWDMSKIAGEVRDPQRNLPRALALGLIVVAASYVLTSAVFVYLVPFEQVTSDETFAAQAGEVLFGGAGGLVFSSIVMISVLGSLASVILGAPRVYYAMACDGLFLKPVAQLHPRFGSPVRAIAIQAVVASVLALSGTFAEILGYFMFVVVLFVGLTVAGLFPLRRQNPEFSGYRTPLYPATPIVFLTMVLTMLVLLVAQSPRSALGVAVVMLGVPVYQLFFRKPNAQGA